ncbi:unnamed protein product [Linum trigynum]|uniref:RNase H type-1 domain-containing protein n=1 Tax=Linum trigynum TaxID=586398 RepID=A0AAV2CM71_9ROSI
MNHAKEVLFAIGMQFQPVEDPMVVELLVLREAIVWCLDHGFTVMRFEGDAKVVIEKIARGDTSDNRVGAVLEEILQYFVVHSGFNIRFVGRRNNKVAHLVAHKVLSLYQTISLF